VDETIVKEKGQVIRNKERKEGNGEGIMERRWEGRTVVLQMIGQYMKRSRR
jgi:hypothetical protein